jgi:hypothetical protein
MASRLPQTEGKLWCSYCNYSYTSSAASASLPIISNKDKIWALLRSRFILEVTADDVEKSLKEQLSL